MFTAEFSITSLIVVLIPGTGVVFTVSTGLAHGHRASFFATLGCTPGIVPHLGGNRPWLGRRHAHKLESKSQVNAGASRPLP